MSIKDQSLSPQDAIRQANEASLAELGHKQEIKGEFAPIELLGIAFSTVGLVPSISTVLFYAIPNGGGPAMVWGWLVANIFTVFVGLSMAELASADPTSGAMYSWTYSLAPKKWKNVLCWIVGCANTIASVATLASVDWGVALQVTAAVTICTDGNFEATNAQLFGIYAAIIISHAFVCCLETRVLARLQIVYIVLNTLFCIALTIALPVATPKEFRNSAKFALWDFTNLSGWPNGFAFIYSFLAPLWITSSFDSSLHISEKTSSAPTAVPWAILGVIGMEGILGWAINIALAFCMGADLQALADSEQPMVQIFVNSFGQNATLVIWVVVVLMQYILGSSTLLAASKQTCTFSRDGAFPFSKWLSKINPYTKTLAFVWLDALLSLILGLLVFAGEQAINAVFSMPVTPIYIAYAIPIIVRFTGENNFQPGPFSLGAFSLPVAIVSVLFMLFLGIVFLFPANPGINPEDMNYSAVVIGGTMVLSIIWYYFPKYGGVHWFKDPASNTDPGNHPGH